MKYQLRQLKSFKEGTGYLQMDRSCGMAILKNLGFTGCLNKNYLQKESVYAHYNKIMGVWIVENLNKDLTI
jgi:hypothetical protein